MHEVMILELIYMSKLSDWYQNLGLKVLAASVKPDAKPKNAIYTSVISLMLSVYIYFALKIPAIMLQYGNPATNFNLAIPGMLSFAAVISMIGLLMMKRWGFYLYTATCMTAFIINIYHNMPVERAVAGLLGIAIVYGVAQLGKENKTWNNMT